MRNGIKKFVFLLAALIMVAICIIINDGKADEVNISEILPKSANAAEPGNEDNINNDVKDVVLLSENSEAPVFGDINYNTATDTDAIANGASDETLMNSEKNTELTEEAKIVSEMTVEEKVAQLFIITPDALTDNTGVTIAGDATKEAVSNTPVGGLIYMSDNLQSPTQVKEMLANTNKYSKETIGLPMFLCVDEEGGTVARVAGSGRFGVDNVGNMADIGENGTVQDAKDIGVTIGTYLSDLGFNVDFAPVADALTNPDNTIVKSRSFGADISEVSDMSVAVAEGLGTKGIKATYKHFPGHGATAGDTHLGAAYTTKSLDELKEEDLVPFKNAVDNGAEFIMVSHISVPNITGHDTPASLSEKMISDILRGDLGYNGIVITDALEMGAISQKYTSDEAAIMAINAGADMILMPEDFETAYNGVVDAVKSGKISEERLDESVERIVKVKLELD